MTTPVFLAVITAAILHASWNALVKSGLDKTLSMGAVVIGHLPFALVIIAISPLPDAAALPYLCAGLLFHFGYQWFLIRSYETGDLTQVYPLARGSAPLIVAVVSVFFLGITLNRLELVAIVIIALGIISLAFTRTGSGEKNPAAARLAVTTGLFIAGYSIVDGLGARAADTALGFYGWLALSNSIVMTIYLAWRSPGTLTGIVRKGQQVFWLGGGASYAAYALVVWGFTQAPIATVTALRETSIIFALLIGVLFLKEPFNWSKALSTFMTMSGAFLLRFARHF